MTTATMLRIERTPQLEAAIIRCKKIHPRVNRINATTIRVTGRNGAHVVTILTPKPGMLLASCDCKATTICYCIAAALAYPVPAPQNVTTEQDARANAILIKHTDGIVRVDNWQV